VVAAFSNTAGSAALSGNQTYGPYGHRRYNTGGLSGMGTSKGFSGQYADAFSGLDYYNARYYQPAVGVFLSADSKEGNQQGMNPYMYVGGNPQTYNDPTGEFYAPPPQGNGSPPPTCVQLNDCWSGSGGNPPTPPPLPPDPPATVHSNPKIVLSGGETSNPSTWQSRLSDAQNAAFKAFRTFLLAGAVFSALAAASHAIANALEGASIPAWLSEILAPLGLSADILALHFESIAAAAAVLATESGVLSALFGFQASFGSDWWSNRSNIIDFFDGPSGVNRIIEDVGSSAAVVSAGLLWFSRFVPNFVIKIIGAGAWYGALGVTAVNAEMFRPWSQQAEHDELHAMFGD
jgi:RHS repeat-associated protein